jgi:hypothetical protein
VSAQLYSVTIRCEYCDELISQSGAQRKYADISLLRSKMHKLGWKSTSEMVNGKQIIHDYCPNCSYEHGVG